MTTVCLKGLWQMRELQMYMCVSIDTFEETNDLWGYFLGYWVTS